MQHWLRKEDGMDKFINVSFLKEKFASFLDAYEHILAQHVSSLQVESTQHDYAKRKSSCMADATLNRILQSETAADLTAVVAPQQRPIEIDFTNKLSFSFTSSKPKRTDSSHSLVELKTATPEFKAVYSPMDYSHANILGSSLHSKRKQTGKSTRKSHSSSCYRESVLSCTCNPHDTLSQISVTSFNTTSFFDSSSEYSEEII